MQKKRSTDGFILALADLHSGSLFGLVPPEHRFSLRKEGKPDAWSDWKWDACVAQRTNEIAYWDSFLCLIRALPRCKAIFILGDLVEGPQHKTGGAGLVSPSDEVQVDIATDVVSRVSKAAGRPPIYGVFGTEYHVTRSGGAEAESQVYENLRNSNHDVRAYANDLDVEVDGVMFGLRHFIGRSSSPYGKQTPLAKEIVVRTLESGLGSANKADILLYGHVHYSVMSGYPTSGKYAMSCPALKRRGESYGRRFSGIYDVGLLMMEQKGDSVWPQKGWRLNCAYQPGPVLRCK